MGDELCNAHSSISSRSVFVRLRVLGMLVLFESLCVLQGPRLLGTPETFAIQALAQKPL